MRALCGRANVPARGLGPGLGLKYEIVCGSGLAIYLMRAGPGPGVIIQFAGRARAGCAQLMRVRAGLGLKSCLQAGPGPRSQAPAGTYYLSWLNKMCFSLARSLSYLSWLNKMCFSLARYPTCHG